MNDGARWNGTGGGGVVGRPGGRRDGRMAERSMRRERGAGAGRGRAGEGRDGAARPLETGKDRDGRLHAMDMTSAEGEE